MRGTCTLCRGKSGNSSSKCREWWSFGKEERARPETKSAGHAWQKRGGIVKRNVLILGVAIFFVAGVMLAQDQTGSTNPKKTASHGAAGGSALRGKEVFEKKCSMCHFADSDQKKIGPGLKGISKRGTFTVNGNKVTTQSLTTWIENGDSLMPGMKDTLEPGQIKDVVAYVKTL
jgi:cytochrome c